MGNTIVFGLLGLSVFLLISCLIIWLTGRKKITALKEKLIAFRDKKNALTEQLAALEEECRRIEPLETEVEQYRQRQENMQAKISKLAADLAVAGEKAKTGKTENDSLQEKIGEISGKLAAEIEKTRKLEELENELAREKATIEALQSATIQDKTTIAALKAQSQKNQEKAEEQSDILDRLKKVFV